MATIIGMPCEHFSRRTICPKPEGSTLQPGPASSASPNQILTHYTISAEDVAGPFEKQTPTGLVEMAQLSGLSYSSPLAELAETFHMSESLLKELNPRANFSQPGADIVVAAVSPMLLRSGRHAIEARPPTASEAQKIARAETIIVDKPARNVRAYDKKGKLLAFYPATMGSEEKPAPSGAFKVRRVEWNPDYVYDPRFAWKGVNTNRKLTISPGPNNPVGLVWIDLTAPSYGIHGTPQPEDIGKTQSHGCVRLTNWDAVELASMVGAGAVVRFEDQDSPVAPLSVATSEGGAPKSKHQLP
jgi:lipoprotein-anchoring transpeptidase ErfK/SrfK